MISIDLRKDVDVVRNELIKRLSEIANTVNPDPITAIEVGYECCDGWIVIHAVRQKNYEPMSEWADNVEDNDVLPMPQWSDFFTEYSGDHDIVVTRFDGSTFVDPAPNSDYDYQDNDTDYPQLFTDAIGEMLLSVLSTVRSDKLFEANGGNGTIPIVVEDFRCSWAGEITMRSTTAAGNSTI